MASGRIDKITPVIAGPAGAFPWGRVETVGDDGTRLALSYAPHEGAVRSTLEVAYFPPGRGFGTCPICLVEPDNTAEHVPNRGLGGHVVTRTCRRCNNSLGGTLESHLVSWVTDSWSRPRFATEKVRGQRRLPRIDVRWADDGQFGLLIAGAVPREVDASLRAGAEFSITVPKPDMAWVRLAALKHAYLAACLALGEIVRGPTADVIRGVLTIVRDIPAREPIPDNIATWVSTLRIGRTYQPPNGVPVAIMAREPVPDAGPVDACICLGGVVMVAWPLPEFTLAAIA